MWQTAYFKPDKSALKDLKDQVLVCSYYKKAACGDLGMTWYSCCTLFTVVKQERLESNQIAWAELLKAWLALTIG